MIIQTKLGQQEIDAEKIIFFPHGLIGFESQRSFTLLQIRENSPFLMLQSLDTPQLGLLVADPFSFLPNYSLAISDAEQVFLQVDSIQDLAVLVTATIPPGKPEATSLNLLGPILVNHDAKIGMQVPQADKSLPARAFIHQKIVYQKESEQ